MQMGLRHRDVKKETLVTGPCHRSLTWKRGTYELETLPGDLARLELGAVERFSWSSALDIIEDLGEDQSPAEEKGLCCQNPACMDKGRATKIGKQAGLCSLNTSAGSLERLSDLKG
ncbi:pleckstrin homology domain-containing family G member 5 isoform d [Cricetulus griseus]|nr:pleckstrin homology domain-containing family G member 5 isoform d [Cricetulus griseus]